jgi:hypothetical protein
MMLKIILPKFDWKFCYFLFWIYNIKL